MSKNVSEKKMSFLPEDYVERQIERRTSLMCLGMFALMLLCAVGAFTYKWSQLNEAREVQGKINTEFSDAARRLEQLDALQLQRGEMLRKAQVTATLLERVPRSYLLADLVNRMPQSLSLLELSVNTKVVKPTAPPRSKSALANAKKEKKTKEEEEAEKRKLAETPPSRTVTLTLTGVAPTDVQVSQYMKSLGESPLFTSVGLISSEESKLEESVLRKFKLDIVLSPTADVRVLDADERKQKRPRDPMEQPDALPGIDGLPKGTPVVEPTKTEATP